MVAAQSFYDGSWAVRPLAQLAPYFEAGENGRVYGEVNLALMGENGSSVRVNENRQLVLSVAVPIRRFGTLYGVLMLTTESGDIDDILKDERAALVEVFVARVWRAVALLALSRGLHRSCRSGDLRRRPSGCAAAAQAANAIPAIPDRGDEIGESCQCRSPP